MAYTFLRQAIDLLWHKGPIHEPVEDGYYWKLRDAIADNLEIIRDTVQTAAYIREPENTPVFSDLEKEYGLIGNENLSLETRTLFLKSARYRKKTTAQDDQLQALLDQAGFNLTVYNNSPDGPAVDPAIIIDQNFVMQAGDQTNDYAGQDDAYAGRVGGYYLLNGALYDQFPAYFGAGDIYAGNDVAVAGYFEYLRQEFLTYPNPTDGFTLCFFVGGDATFDAVTGEILTIQQGLVPSPQRQKLDNIILQFKPLFTRACMVVSYT
ncbi:MAG: hypothetical protein P8X74_03665 [Reinekea sp.]